MIGVQDAVAACRWEAVRAPPGDHEILGFAARILNGPIVAFCPGGDGLNVGRPSHPSARNTRIHLNDSTVGGS